MHLTINGKDEDLPTDALTVAELIERNGLSAAVCAIEVNRVLVPRREHAERRLSDGDAVEIVTLVGGG